MTLLSPVLDTTFTKSLWWALLPLISVCLLYPNAIAQRHPVQPCLMHCQDGASLIPAQPDQPSAYLETKSAHPLDRTSGRTALSFRLTPHPTGSPSPLLQCAALPSPFPPYLLLPGLSEIRGYASLGPRAAFRLHLSVALRIQRFSRCAPSGGRSRALSVPYAHPGRFSRPQTEKRWIYGSLDGISNGSQGTQKTMSPAEVWALAVGAIIGWGCFVLPGARFLPEAGPIGSVLASLSAAASCVSSPLLIASSSRPIPWPAARLPMPTSVSAKHGPLFADGPSSLAISALSPPTAPRWALLSRALLPGVFDVGYLYSVAGWDVYAGELAMMTCAFLFFGT